MEKQYMSSLLWNGFWSIYDAFPSNVFVIETYACYPSVQLWQPSSSSILTSHSSIIILKRTIVDEKGKQNIHSYNLPLPETLQKLQNRKNLHIIHLTSVFVERHDNQVFPTCGKRVSHQWEKSFPHVGKPCSACLVWPFGAHELLPQQPQKSQRD